MSMSLKCRWPIIATRISGNLRFVWMFVGFPRWWGVKKERDDSCQLRHYLLRHVHTGNKLLPKTATICCHQCFRQQFVADFGNKLLPETATNCCRFRQQIVAENGNNLLPVASVDRPLGILESLVLLFATVYRRTVSDGQVYGCG